MKIKYTRSESERRCYTYADAVEAARVRLVEYGHRGEVKPFRNVALDKPLTLSELNEYADRIFDRSL